MIRPAQRQIDHGEPVRRRGQRFDGGLKGVGHVDRQAEIGQDLGHDLLPGAVVFDHQGAR